LPTPYRPPHGDSETPGAEAPEFEDNPSAEEPYSVVYQGAKPQNYGKVSLLVGWAVALLASALHYALVLMDWLVADKCEPFVRAESHMASDGEPSGQAECEASAAVGQAANLKNFSECLQKEGAQNLAYQRAQGGYRSGEGRLRAPRTIATLAPEGDAGICGPGALARARRGYQESRALQCSCLQQPRTQWPPPRLHRRQGPKGGKAEVDEPAGRLAGDAAMHLGNTATSRRDENSWAAGPRLRFFSIDDLCVLSQVSRPCCLLAARALVGRGEDGDEEEDYKDGDPWAVHRPSSHSCSNLSRG
jgi:hypothetical protein